MESAPTAAGDARRKAELCGRIVVYITLFGMLGGFLWAYRAAFYKGLGYPSNTFLFRPENAFGDLKDFFGPVLSGDPLTAYVSVYPPFSYVLMEPFARIGGNASVAILAAICCTGLAIFAWWELSGFKPVDRVALVLVLAGFNFPVLYAIDRANIDVFATLFVAAAIVSLQTRRSFSGAIFVGAAAATKIYPAIFLLLLVKRREWWPTAAGVGVALILTFSSFAVFSYSPLEGTSALAERLSVYTNAYAVGDEGLRFGSSLYGMLKVFLVPDVVSGQEAIQNLLTAYTAFSILVGLVVIVMLVMLPLAFWEQVTLLTSACLLLPSVSADYRLVLLVVPLALFLREGTTTRLSLAVTTCFALLLVPKPYFQVKPPDVNVGVVVNPFLLLTLMALVAGAGIARSRSKAPKGAAPNMSPA